MSIDTSDPEPTAAPTAFDATWLARLPIASLFSLQGRVAVIAGAAGGVGSWLCAGLGLAGARILATDRVASDVSAVCAELREAGVDAEAHHVDLEDPDAAARIIGAATDRFQRLDVLINNAGINRRVPMLEVGRDLHEEIWRVDYTRWYELSQVAARVMIDAGAGSIIHIGSINNRVGLEDVSMLGPTKAALSQLAKAMTVEFGHLGVRTNVLAPGFLIRP